MIPLGHPEICLRPRRPCRLPKNAAHFFTPAAPDGKSSFVKHRKGGARTGCTVATEGAEKKTAPPRALQAGL
jgi:hypothetical protein